MRHETYINLSAMGGLYHISSMEGLTIGFDGHFEELSGLKFQTVSKPVKMGFYHYFKKSALLKSIVQSFHLNKICQK